MPVNSLKILRLIYVNLSWLRRLSHSNLMATVRLNTSSRAGNLRHAAGSKLLQQLVMIWKDMTCIVSEIEEITPLPIFAL